MRYYLRRRRVWRKVGVLGHEGEEFVGAVEEDAEAVLDRLHAETHGEVRFADARWSLDEEGLFGAEPGAGGEGVDAGAFDRGLEGEVEVAERETGRQSGEAEAGADAAFVAELEFRIEQLIEEGAGADLVLDGVRDEVAQALGGVRETEALQARLGGVEIDLRLGSFHRAASARAA